MQDLITRRHLLLTGGAALALAANPAAAHDRSLPAEFMPQLVQTGWTLPAGEIHVLPDQFFLYLMLEDGAAMRYGVGVGRASLYQAGTFTVGRKAKWPWWRPTKAMIKREPDKYARFKDGVPGGKTNPLGARALYLVDDQGRDTYLRIHGTNAPNTIGSAVSNGCARLVNDHVIDLYDRVPVGARVVLHPKRG